MKLHRISCHNLVSLPTHLPPPPPPPHGLTADVTAIVEAARKQDRVMQVQVGTHCVVDVLDQLGVARLCDILMCVVAVSPEPQFLAPLAVEVLVTTKGSVEQFLPISSDIRLETSY